VVDRAQQAQPRDRPAGARAPARPPPAWPAARRSRAASRRRRRGGTARAVRAMPGETLEVDIAEAIDDEEPAPQHRRGGGASRRVASSRRTPVASELLGAAEAARLPALAWRGRRGGREYSPEREERERERERGGGGSVAAANGRREEGES
jgi:hypothetical protein